VSALAARPGVATTFLRWTFTRAMFHKGYVLVSGLSVIWVNRRTTSEVRATVRSFLSQAECAGEIASGFPLAVVAQAAGIPAALMTSGALITCVGAMVARSRVARSGAGVRR